MEIKEKVIKSVVLVYSSLGIMKGVVQDKYEEQVEQDQDKHSS